MRIRLNRKYYYMFIILLIVLNGCSTKPKEVTFSSSMTDMSVKRESEVLNTNHNPNIDLWEIHYIIEAKNLKQYEIVNLNLPEISIVEDKINRTSPDSFHAGWRLEMDNSKNLIHYEYHFRIDMNELSEERLNEVLETIKFSITLEDREEVIETDEFNFSIGE